MADAPAAVHALSDGDGNPLGRDEQRRQHRRGLLRPVAQRGGRGPPRDQKLAPASDWVRLNGAAPKAAR